MSVENFLQAIKGGDVDSLRIILRDHPEYLEKANLKFGDGYGGFALNAAAFYNQPQVIEFLVEEKEVDVNRQEGVSGLWAALHHACESNSYQAAEILLQLGANSQLKTESGVVPYDKCKSGKIIELLSSGAGALTKKTKEQKIAGKWSLTSPSEVVYTRDLPEQGLRLTEIFNFESRRVTAITKDLRGGHLAQNILFFDDISDTQFVHQAHAKLTELGGTADASVIDRRPLNGKSPLLRP
ncbi:MAG: ankyrin repeat domain-containing protein [Alphaproteobacteria bacterium]|nr:ankyrin repeat domain-containing protein [Alphaproteobacteria bacterium]